MQLKDYLYIKKITQAEFARKLGITRGSLNRLIQKKHLKGVYKKTAKLFEDIERYTEGQVTREDLVSHTESLAERIFKMDTSL